MTSSSKNPKTLLHSSSILGLDKMIEDRKAEGNLTNNVVHMEVSNAYGVKQNSFLSFSAC